MSLEALTLGRDLLEEKEGVHVPVSVAVALDAVAEELNEGPLRLKVLRVDESDADGRLPDNEGTEREIVFRVIDKDDDGRLTVPDFEIVPVSGSENDTVNEPIVAEGEPESRCRVADGNGEWEPMVSVADEEIEFRLRVITGDDVGMLDLDTLNERDAVPTRDNILRRIGTDTFAITEHNAGNC